MRKFYNRFIEFIQETAETLVVSFAIFIVVNWFLAQPFEVNGDSMLINFENGEHILTDKLTYRFREPQRGDVVVFKFPRAERFDYIKRIIALPGEEIKIENGKVYIFNEGSFAGFELFEPYLFDQGQTFARSFIKENLRLKVPEGNYIVMGDNRNNSSDSREWGFVPKENIVGKAVFRYWPPQALAVIDNPTY